MKPYKQDNNKKVKQPNITGNIETIKVTLSRCVYRKEDTGYTIFGSVGGQSLVGTVLDMEWTRDALTRKLAGVRGEFTGKWIENKDPKYWPNFQFSSYRIGDDDESPLFHFLTRVMKGLGTATAKRLIEKFGDDELERIIEHAPNKLLEEKGITKKRLDRIVAKWNKFKQMKWVSDFLAKYGITEPFIVQKVYQYVTSKNITSLDTIIENPYRLTEVNGIGFKTADQIGMKMGIAYDDPRRIEAAIVYQVEQSTDNGNSLVVAKEVFSDISKQKTHANGNDGLIPGLDRDIFQQGINKLVSLKKLVHFGKGKITTPELESAELSIISRFRDARNHGVILEDIEKFIKEKEAEYRFEFGEDQKQAIRMVNSGVGSFALCGYAGTGKTTVSRAILELLAMKFGSHNIIGCALSGVAADRVRIKTGFDAKTIQSLIVRSEFLGEERHEKVIFIDESAMVNSPLLAKVLDLFDQDTVIIGVGDPGQVSAIGAGDPFRNIIQYSLCSVVELTKIYRVDDNLKLAVFAGEIRKNQVPEGYASKHLDFEFHRVERKDEETQTDNDEKICSMILGEISAINNEIKSRRSLTVLDDIKWELAQWQVITPYRRAKSGVLSAESLNVALQELVNPGVSEKDSFGEFRLGDKVIHTENADMDFVYQADKYLNNEDSESISQRIFNGMMGKIINIDKEDDETVAVIYPEADVVVEYEISDVRKYLSLAYSLSIHKVQGSEYERVFIPTTNSHSFMWNNRLLYTAITRAKKKAELFGEQKAFENACKKSDTNRTTIIMEIMSQEEEKKNAQA